MGDKGQPDPTAADAETRPLDTRGLRCPLPVIRLEALLRRVPEGTIIRVQADDPIAAVDIPHFAREGGHSCVRIAFDEDTKTPSECVFEVTKASIG